jgi:hypothetical protein
VSDNGQIILSLIDFVACMMRYINTVYEHYSHTEGEKIPMWKIIDAVLSEAELKIAEIRLRIKDMVNG